MSHSSVELDQLDVVILYSNYICLKAVHAWNGQSLEAV